MKRVEKTIGDTSHAALFDEDGVLQQEMYSCGNLALHRVRNESGFEDTYLLAGRVITAAKYDVARKGREGMPRAIPEQDGLGQVLAALGDAKEVVQFDSEEDSRIRDIFDRAESLERFLRNRGSIFGETPQETADLCRSLIDAGASVKIDEPRHSSEVPRIFLARGLVLKLPRARAKRHRVFEILKPHAARSGYPIDDGAGTRYLYVIDT